MKQYDPDKYIIVNCDAEHFPRLIQPQYAGLKLIIEYLNTKYHTNICCPADNTGRLIALHHINDVSLLNAHLFTLQGLPGDFRQAYIISNLSGHAKFMVYIRESGEEGILYSDSTDTTIEYAKKIHQETGIPTYINAGATGRQSDKYSCYIDALVFARDTTAFNPETLQYRIPNLLLTLKTRLLRTETGIDEILLPDVLLKTAQRTYFVKKHQENLTGCIIHKGETLETFRARYQKETNEPGRTVSSYLIEKGEKYHDIIHIQFYLHKLEKALGTLPTLTRLSFIRDAKKILAKDESASLYFFALRFLIEHKRIQFPQYVLTSVEIVPVNATHYSIPTPESNSFRKHCFYLFAQHCSLNYAKWIISASQVIDVLKCRGHLYALAKSDPFFAKALLAHYPQQFNAPQRRELRLLSQPSALHESSLYIRDIINTPDAIRHIMIFAKLDMYRFGQLLQSVFLEEDAQTWFKLFEGLYTLYYTHSYGINRIFTVLCNLKDALKHEPKITLFSQNAYDAVSKKYDELKPDFQNWQDTIQATKTFITRGLEPLENASIVPAIALKPLETEITSITALWKYLWKDAVYFEFLDMAIHKRFEYASAHARYNQALSWAEMTIIGHLNKVASLSTCRIEYRPTLEQGIEQYNILAQDLEALTQSPNCLEALKLLVATDKPAIWQQAIEEKQLCLLSAKNKHIKRMTILSNMLKAVSAIIINFGQCHTSVEAWNHHQKLKQQVDELTELPNLVAYQKLNEIEEAYNNRVELIKIKQQTIQYLARINFETHLNSFLALTQQLTETHQSKAAEILCHELVTARLTFEAATGTFDANKNIFMAECRDALRKSKSVFEQHNNWQRTMNTFISTLVTCTTIGRYHFMPPPKQKILTGIAEMEHTLILR